jgi:hypothetical protein
VALEIDRNGSILYKDTRAAKGSDLYKALQDKDMKKAEQIYQQCEEDARKLLNKKKPHEQ